MSSSPGAFPGIGAGGRGQYVRVAGVADRSARATREAYFSGFASKAARVSGDAKRYIRDWQ
jgi:hypothetical protein